MLVLYAGFCIWHEQEGNSHFLPIQTPIRAGLGGERKQFVGENRQVVELVMRL